MSAEKDWNQAWLETQKQYWNTWLDWSRTATEAVQVKPTQQGFPFGMGQGMGQGFGQGFPPGVDQWFKLVGQNLSGEGADFYSKTLNAGQSYFDMGQMFWGMVRDMQTAGEEWKSVLDKNMSALKDSMQLDPSSATDAWSAYAGNWGLNGGAWGDFMKTLGQSPVDASDMMGVNAAEAWERMFKTPAMGYGRESQEQYQQWALLAGDSTKAMQAYAALLNETNGKAVEMMKVRLSECIPKGEMPGTMRGLYDLWVDCGESAYQELSTDERFLKAQGALMNSVMSLKKHENEMAQGVLKMLNIPNRREMDTALRRLHDVRAELRDLEDRIEDSELESMGKQLSEMRDQIRILQEQQTPALEGVAKPAAAAPVKKTAARKPAARKPAARKPAAAKTTTKTTEKKGE